MKLLRHKLIRWLSGLLLAVALASPVLAQQSGSVQYVYDALGRLIKVIDSNGNVAEYVYDKVGNILEIKRSTISGLVIFSFAPQQGSVGTMVTIQGQGFSATSSANLVLFNGAAAAVTSASSSSLVVTVPPGATTGTHCSDGGGEHGHFDQQFYRSAVDYRHHSHRRSCWVYSYRFPGAGW